MRRARVILFLFLIAGGVAAYYGFRNGLELPSVPTATGPAVSPQNAQRPEQAKSARPSFDVVRAEPTGEVIMAGRAEPGWSVTVESEGKAIGRAVADNNGEWVMEPSVPLGKGEHSLQLKSQPPKGGQTLFSSQRLALSLGQPGKDRPLVALTEEGKATRVLQMPPSSPEEKRLGALAQNSSLDLQNPPFKPAAAPFGETSAQVTFTSIDYEHAAEGSMVYVNGRATPGARVMLYIANEFAGALTADATGSWTYGGRRQLGAGTHVLRADQVELATGKVLARAEVNFDRESPKVIAGGDMATGASQLGLLSRNTPQGTPPRPNAGAGQSAAAPALSGAPTLSITDANGDSQVIIVRRGDTLWQIAARHYGNGTKFTQIFQGNRGQIRNPDLIYPSQRFAMPR